MCILINVLQIFIFFIYKHPLKNMQFKSILVVVTVLIVGVMACTETGKNCQYSYECCSGACSAVFKFCLHR
ncbi:conotoxin-like peptide [Condylorrhiza vestigialis mutiple nucleopolyhedrovirus]|uniref:Conotoxin-like peptide n=1 Tax=Condylorrhiza vestigialis mutiple nucleopolyhedrovirus TaxID=1592576 RepID=A0A0B4UM78_9ABAC|nr:conotoxin-like peptide [Condylorrhiza vestigialis mutiple nucleopolyhedrovirus]AJD09278.1 conotoxin-like peptide [Condylorrhiza vestigialis mutiple nucleopolyhedrovirus]